MLIWSQSYWVFRHIFYHHSHLHRYKGRLVTKRFSQLSVLDYYKTFSPFVKPTTIRTLLNIAVSRSLHIHMLDVKNSYLNDDLSYVDISFPHHMCLLLMLFMDSNNHQILCTIDLLSINDVTMSAPNHKRRPCLISNLQGPEGLEVMHKTQWIIDRQASLKHYPDTQTWSDYEKLSHSSIKYKPWQTWQGQQQSMP